MGNLLGWEIYIGIDAKRKVKLENYREHWGYVSNPLGLNVSRSFALVLKLGSACTGNEPASMMKM
jgi:hypothetical protein